MTQVFQMKIGKVLPNIKEIKMNLEMTKLWQLLWVSYLTKTKELS